MGAWKCSTMALGVLFVTISSTNEKQRLCAHKWDEMEDLCGTADMFQTGKEPYGWTTSDAVDVNSVWSSVLSVVPSMALISGANTTVDTKKTWECAAEDRHAQPS